MDQSQQQKKKHTPPWRKHVRRLPDTVTSPKIGALSFAI